MKKKLIYIIICFLAITLLTVGIVLMIRQNKPLRESISGNSIVPTTAYTVALKDSPGFDFEYVPYNGDNELALFITSFESHFSVNVEITFLDSGHQIISTNKITNKFVSAKKKFIVSTVVDTENVKFIEVKIIPEEFTEGDDDFVLEILDNSKLDFKTKSEVDANNNTIITLNVMNPYEQVINLVNGYVLLYNSSKLVDTVPFNSVDIAQGEEISIEVNTNLHDTTGTFEYDKIEVIVNELF